MEQHIINQLKNQKEQGISLVLDQYGGLLKHIVTKYIGGHPQEIEECVADIVIAAWYHIDDFDPQRNSLKNWLAVIAKFKAIDRLRKLQRAGQQDELSDQVPATATQSINWQEVLEQLSPQEQRIFKRYYFEGSSARELATEYEAKESWIHNKLSRSRKKLRTYFQQEEGLQ